MNTSKVKVIYSYLLTRRYSTISRKAGLHHMWWLFGQTNAITLNVFPFLFLAADLSTEHDTVWCGTSLGSVVVSCPGCIPFPCTSSLLLLGWVLTEKRPLILCKHCSEVTKSSLCYLLRTYTEHGHIQAVVKEINSIPDKTNTPKKASKHANKQTKHTSIVKNLFFLFSFFTFENW